MSTDSPQIPNEPNEPNDEPHVTRDDTYFGGRILRFVGMLVMVGVIMYAGIFEDWRLSGDEIAVLLVIGLAGAATHFAGRKLAPGAHGASFRGGLLAVIGVPIALLLVVLLFFTSLLRSCGVIN